MTSFPRQSFIGVVGMLRDKDFKASLSEFAKVCDSLILTEVPNPRSAKAEELLLAAETMGIPAVAVPNPEEAVLQAFRDKQEGQGVLCVGSLYALPIFKTTCQKVVHIDESC